MSLLSDHLLTLIVFLPLLGAGCLFAFPAEGPAARRFALALSVVGWGLTGLAWLRFDPGVSTMQLAESAEWVPTFGIRYAVAVDGVSLLLVVLTALLQPIVIVSSFPSVRTGSRDYLIGLLALQTCMLGAFVATDLFLFYVFYELMLVPTFFLLGYGSGLRRIDGKLVLFNSSGAVLMLVAILYTVWAVRDPGGLTFDWLEVTERLRNRELGEASLWLFLAFALAFAIKAPVFPFHSWFPDACVEAPTGLAVLLAAVSLKVGAHSLLRFPMMMFPKAALVFLPALGTLAVIGILYGALLAMVQTDLKRLIAYASFSQLGFVLLGLAAMTVSGVTGGVVHMVSHGVSTAGLLLLVGVVYERRHTTELDAFGGLAAVMPRYAFTFGFLMLSSAGLPGLNGFVGELLILVGTFSSEGVLIEATTGQLATFVCALAGALGVGAVILVTLAMGRAQRHLGPGTRAAATVATALLAAGLLLPPVNDFEGGLLLRPLNDYVLQTSAFSEVFAVFAVLAAVGCILTAIYFLRATQRLLLGPIDREENRSLPDLNLRELVVLLPLMLVALGCGVYPKPLLDVIEPTAERYARDFRSAADLPIRERSFDR